MAGRHHKARQEQAAYIESMIVELRSMSLDLEAPVLAYFLEMAMIEAHEMAQEIQVDPSDVDEGIEARAERYMETN